MHKEKDAEILYKIKEPSLKEEGFRLLMSIYKKPLYWHVRKMVMNHEDTNDILQNSFLKIWKNIEHFREDAALYTWLYRITTNETLSFLKSKSLKYTRMLTDNSQTFEEVLKADPYFDGSDIEIKLRKAVLNLPDKQRLIFNMKYFDELKFKEISEILNTSVGSLKASYHIAVKKIESEMKENL